MMFTNKDFHTNTTLFLFPSDDAVTDAISENILLDGKISLIPREANSTYALFLDILLHLFRSAGIGYGNVYSVIKRFLWRL